MMATLDSFRTRTADSAAECRRPSRGVGHLAGSGMPVRPRPCGVDAWRCRAELAWRPVAHRRQPDGREYPQHHRLPGAAFSTGTVCTGTHQRSAVRARPQSVSVLRSRIPARCAHAGPCRAEITRRHGRMDNVVAACKRCNHHKGNRLPHECGMELLALPYVPNTAEYLALINSGRILGDQMDFLASQFGHSRRDRGKPPAIGGAGLARSRAARRGAWPARAAHAQR